MRAADYGTDELGRLLAAVLSDSEFHLVQARLWLGDITEGEVSWPLPDRDAGLTEDEQSVLAGRPRARRTEP